MHPQKAIREIGMDSIILLFVENINALHYIRKLLVLFFLLNGK